jgi:hypothetical protein
MQRVLAWPLVPSAVNGAAVRAFFSPHQPNEPLPIFTAPGIISAEFAEPFTRLREDLERNIRASLAVPPHAQVEPPAPSGPEPVSAPPTIHVGDHIPVTGDFDLATAANFQSSFNKASRADVNDHLKEQLQALTVQIAELAKTLPPDEAERVSKDLETLTSEAVSTKPRKAWFELSGHGFDRERQVGARHGRPRGGCRQGCPGPPARLRASWPLRTPPPGPGGALRVAAMAERIGFIPCLDDCLGAALAVQRIRSHSALRLSWRTPEKEQDHGDGDQHGTVPTEVRA